MRGSSKKQKIENQKQKIKNRKQKIENGKSKTENRKNKRAGIWHCTKDRLAFYDSLSQPGSTAAGAASYDMAKKISGK